MATLAYDELIDALRRSGRKESSTAIADPPKPTPTPAQCGPGCYSIGDGKRIHRPWTGQCKAKFQALELRQVERECWHCKGSTRCGCIACAEGLGACTSGPC